MSALEGKLLQAANPKKVNSSGRRSLQGCTGGRRRNFDSAETRRSGLLEDAVKYVSSAVVSSGTRSAACRVVCNGRLQSNCLE